MFITDNCSDYKVISRYLTPPHPDFVAGKQSLKKHVSTCHNFTIWGGGDPICGICNITIMKYTLFPK